MFLDKIIASVEDRLASLGPQMADLKSRARNQSAPRPFAQALHDAYPIGIIAECKHRSPSKGWLTDHYDPVAQAQYYEQHGATCISVLTEPEFFSGALSHLESIKNHVSIPVLRKDFIRDPRQIIEARAYGADAILLIMRILDDPVLTQELWQTAREWKMDVLVEIHSASELTQALELDPMLVGINNRDLDTFETRLGFSEDMARKIPAHVVRISESGIFHVDDVKKVKSWGYQAVLVGEALMRGNPLLEEIALWRSE